MIETVPRLVEGIGLTLSLLLTSLLGGGVLGSFLCAALLSRFKIVPVLAKTYVTFFRGTPALVQLFVIYYDLAQFDWVRASPMWVLLWDPFWCCVLAFSLNSGAYTAEVMRGALSGVPVGIREAGAALGLNRFVIFYKITVPLSLRLFLPPYGNEVVSMLKTTALASTVTLLDLTGVARTIVAQTYAPYEIFISAAFIYLILAWALERGIAYLEQRSNHWVC